MEAAAEEAQELWPASPTLSQWANGWWADLWHIPRGLSFRRLVALLGLHRFLLELLSGGTKADLPNDLRRFWCVCRVCACVCVFGTGSRCPTVRQFESVRHSANSVVRVGVDYQCVGLLFFWLSTLRAVDSAPSGHSPFVGCVRLHSPVRDGVVLSYDYLVWWWAAYQLNVLTMQVLHSDDMRLVKPRQPVSFDFIQSRWASGRIFIQIANCGTVPLHGRWFAVADSSEIDTTHFWHPTDWLEKMWIKDGAGRFLGGKQWSSTCCCSLRADGLRHFIFFHTHLVRRPVLHLFRRLWCVSVACGSHLNETIGRWGAPSISGHRDASDRIPHSPRPTFA